MLNPPKTRKDAQSRRYGASWREQRYDPTRCAHSVREQGRWPIFHQCTRKPGHGPAGLYCRQHAEIVGDA